MISYAGALLAQQGFAEPGPPGGAWEYYRHNEQVRRRLAVVVADRASRNYLVAAMAAFQLGEDAEILDPQAADFDPSAVPSGIGEALSKHLDRLPARQRRREAGLLTALAYGRGAGLDDRQWLLFTRALGYEDVTAADLAELRASPAADYLLESSTERDVPVTRLFHQALADELVRGRHRHVDEDLLLDAMLASMADAGWMAAPQYARDYLAAHAAAAGRLDDLLVQPDYLLVASPAGLLPHLPEARADTTVRTARLYQRVAHHFAALTPQARAALLQSAAVRDEPAAAGDLSFAVDPLWRTLWAETSTSPHQTLTGHEGVIGVLASTVHGGRTLLASGGEGEIRIWDAASGLLVSQVSGHGRNGITSLAFTTYEGRLLLASGGYDDIIRIWDLGDSQLLAELRGHKDEPTGLSWTTDQDGGLSLVSASMDGTMRWWDLETLEASRIITADRAGVTCLATVTGPGGEVLLASAGRRNTIELWDPLTGASKGTLGSHRRSVRTLATCRHPDGYTLLVSGGDDETVRVWDVRRSEQIASFNYGSNGPVAPLILDGRVVVAAQITSGGYSDPIGIYDLDGNRIAVLGGHTRRLDVLHPLELPDGRVLIASAAADGTVRLWDLTDPERLATTPAPRSGYTDLASFDHPEYGMTMIVGERDGSVAYHDIETGLIRLTRRAHEAEMFTLSLAWTRNRGMLLATAARGDEMRFWDPVTMEPVASYPVDGYEFAIVSDAQQRDLLVTSASTSHPSPLLVQFTDMSTGRTWSTGFRERGSSLTALATTTLCGGDIILAMGDHSGTIRLWNTTLETLDLKVGIPVILYGVHELRFLHLSDGRTWLTAITDAAYVWDLATGQLVHRLSGHEDHLTCHDITSLADGRPVLVTGSPDGTVQVWDLIPGRRLVSIRMDDAVLHCVASGTRIGVSTAHGLSVLDISAAVPPAASPPAVTCWDGEIEPNTAGASFRKGAEAGDSRAMASLAALLKRQGDRHAAEDWLQRAASAGDPEAAYLLGQSRFAQGDVPAADTWWRRAADNGSVYAARLLALMLSHADQTDQVEKFARFAADNGYADGLHLLGWLAEIRGDHAAAEGWYKKVRGGEAESAYRLGVLLDARGEPRDAEHFFRIAETNGHPGASAKVQLIEFRLQAEAERKSGEPDPQIRDEPGDLYARALETRKADEWREWMVLAAAAGHAPAMRALGERYLDDGEWDQARYWLGAAAEHYGIRPLSPGMATVWNTATPGWA